jgi:hypothetical protein
MILSLNNDLPIHPSSTQDHPNGFRDQQQQILQSLDEQWFVADQEWFSSWTNMLTPNYETWTPQMMAQTDDGRERCWTAKLPNSS